MQISMVLEIDFLRIPEISPHKIKIPDRVIKLRGKNKTTHCPAAVSPINPVIRKCIRDLLPESKEGIKL